MRLKNIWVEKSNLFAYFCFYVFCELKEKKIEKRKLKKRETSSYGNVLNTYVPTTRLMY